MRPCFLLSHQTVPCLTYKGNDHSTQNLPHSTSGPKTTETDLKSNVNLSSKSHKDSLTLSQVELKRACCGFLAQLLIFSDFCLFLYFCPPLFLIHVLYFLLFLSRCSHYYPHTHHQSSQHARYCMPSLLSLSAIMFVFVCVCVQELACTCDWDKQEWGPVCEPKRDCGWPVLIR